MGPILGLWRETWWFWILFVVLCAAMALFVTTIYVAFLVILPGIFLYFAYARYDEDGKRKENPHA